MSPPEPPSRKTKASRYENGGPRPLGPTNGPPTRLPPRAPSALSYDHGGETGSDIYVTSAAYKAPSEIRYKILQCVIVIGRVKIISQNLYFPTQSIQCSQFKRTTQPIFGGQFGENWPQQSIETGGWRPNRTYVSAESILSKC